MDKIHADLADMMRAVCRVVYKYILDNRCKFPNEGAHEFHEANFMRKK